MPILYLLLYILHGFMFDFLETHFKGLMTIADHPLVGESDSGIKASIPPPPPVIFTSAIGLKLPLADDDDAASLLNDDAQLLPVVYAAWTVAVVRRGTAESPLAAAMVLAQSVAFTEQINAAEKILKRRHLKSSVNADLGLPSGRGKSGPQRRSDLTFPAR
jgi:hypothetical protein